MDSNLVKKVLVICAGLAMLCITSLKAGSAQNALDEPARVVEISLGVYDVPVVVSDSLQSRKAEFRKLFINAQKKLSSFARANGWEKLVQAPFVRQVEIYDSKDAFDRKIRSLYPDEKQTVIPKTFSAGIENEILFAVSPEIYLANYEDGREAGAYEKLIIHELAHRLHVRIVGGDEERMGPIWFWEGFATYAADQFAQGKPGLSDADIWSIVDAKERGSYKKYNVVFSHFLKAKGLSLSGYVKQAEDPGFRVWLKTPH